MKNYLKEKLQEAIRKAGERYQQKFAQDLDLEIERPKQDEHGDFASNVALVLASQVGEKPRPFAEAIRHFFEDPEGFVESVTIAGPGFLNFRLTQAAWQRSLVQVEAPHFARPNLGAGKKVLIEYVSANPTGPLHVGNARGGPIGDSLARVLTQCGYDVTTEYYVNDVGGQVRRLGHSILHWMKVDVGQTNDLPEEGYFGDYIKELAKKAANEADRDYLDLPEEESIDLLSSWGMRQLLEEIRSDCVAMGSSFDRWVYEHELRKEVDGIIETLKEKGVTRKHEGALWFVPEVPTSEQGERPPQSTAGPPRSVAEEQETNRESVLVRQTGEPTYFADDIVCHVKRYREGFDRIINIWGANHHGHVPRIKSAVQALGYDADSIDVVLYQYVRVCRGQEIVKMSKRAGNYVTAREVLEEVGTDAMRFFLLQRAASAHLDFDLELAKKESIENPIYYIQYAHARIASIGRKAEQKGLKAPDFEEIDPGLLHLPEELDLVKFLFEYPETIGKSAKELAPHHIAFYLLELARKFHAYYSRAKEDPRYRVLADDIDRVRAKLYLLRVVKSVLADGLQILNLTAPEEMKSLPDGEAGPPEEVL